MATKHLKLWKCGDGYFRTQWIDDGGNPHSRSFGRDPTKARNRFNTFHCRWRFDPYTRNPSDDAFLTVKLGWERFKAHATDYYRHADGTPTGALENIQASMRQVLDLFGDLPAHEFGPKALQVVREQMVREDLCLNVINGRVGKICQVFKWLVSEELLPANVWHALQTVPALKAGRTRARVTRPILPVPDAHVHRVMARVPATVRAMIELQYHTGMRPGEVCQMRSADLDMTGSVWMYTPAQHKTAYQGKPRRILLGPRAQRVLRSFLDRDLAAYLFSPREAIAQRITSRGAPLRKSRRKPLTKQRVGVRYSARTYGNCIKEVCRLHDIPVWTPNQLRHNVGTRLRKEFGIDVAQVVLGHSSVDVTQVYAVVDLQKAVAAMEKVG